MGDTTWCFYCLCNGEGLGSFSPLVLSDVKELCLHSQAGTQDCGGDGGVCHNISTCICLTNHLAIPPAKNSYPCAICGKTCGAMRTEGSLMHGGQYNQSEIFEEGCWCWYCFCYGYACHTP